MHRAVLVVACIAVLTTLVSTMPISYGDNDSVPILINPITFKENPAAKTNGYVTAVSNTDKKVWNSPNQLSQSRDP